MQNLNMDGNAVEAVKMIRGISCKSHEILFAFTANEAWAKLSITFENGTKIYGLPEFFVDNKLNRKELCSLALINGSKFIANTLKDKIADDEVVKDEVVVVKDEAVVVDDEVVKDEVVKGEVVKDEAVVIDDEVVKDEVVKGEVVKDELAYDEIVAVSSVVGDSVQHLIHNWYRWVDSISVEYGASLVFKILTKFYSDLEKKGKVFHLRHGHQSKMAQLFILDEIKKDAKSELLLKDNATISISIIENKVVDDDEAVVADDEAVVADDEAVVADDEVIKDEAVVVDDEVVKDEAVKDEAVVADDEVVKDEAVKDEAVVADDEVVKDEVVVDDIDFNLIPKTTISIIKNSMHLAWESQSLSEVEKVANNLLKLFSQNIEKQYINSLMEEH